MKAATVAKLVIIIAALIAAGLYVRHTQQVAAARNEYNRIVELMNDQQHAQAVEALEKLLPTAPGSMQQQIRTDIAKQCLAVSDDPSQPLAESARWVRKASQYDDSVLTEQHRQILAVVK